MFSFNEQGAIDINIEITFNKNWYVGGSNTNICIANISFLLEISKENENTRKKL